MIRQLVALGLALLPILALAGDAFEPDDTPEQARVLMGSTVKTEHSLHSSADIDWFAFTIEDNRAMRIVARNDFDLMELVFYDADINQIRSGSIITRDIGPGTYFFSVESFFKKKGFATDYILFLTLSQYEVDASEPNDSMDDPTPLTVGRFKHLQSIAPVGDQDWFTFEAVAPKQPVAIDFVVEIQPPLRFGWVDVFDQFGQPAILNTPQAQSNRALVRLTPGTNTVRVREINDDEILPIYSIVAWPITDPDPYEADDTPEEATLLMIDGPRQTHNFTDANDEDWYLLFAINDEDMAVYSEAHVDLTMFEADAETIFAGPEQEFLNVRLPQGGGVFYVRATPRENPTSPELSVYSIIAGLNNAGLNVVGSLTGVVSTLTKGGDPIENVDVSLTGNFNAQTFSDSLGVYIFPMLTQGSYNVKISAPGYYPANASFEIGGGVTFANFELEAEVVIEDEDLDQDGMLNSSDIQLVINLVLGIIGSLDGDINNDGDVNASDIQLIINRVLSG